jgi:hypothetical protein
MTGGSGDSLHHFNRLFVLQPWRSCPTGIYRRTLCKHCLARTFDSLRTRYPSTWCLVDPHSYRLVSVGVIPNTESKYHYLSNRTADARRAGMFPDLLDQINKIHLLNCFDGPGDALRTLADQYKLDRTDGQRFNTYIGIEKRAMLPQLEAWFRDYGVPIITFGGYASQTYVNDIIEHVGGDERPSVFIYAGDLDPTGVDIWRDFKARCDHFDTYIKIAVTPEQITQYDLVPSMYDKPDPRRNAFIKEYGAAYQVEVEAIEPAILRGLYQDEFFKFYNLESRLQPSALHQKSLEQRFLLCL